MDDISHDTETPSSPEEDTMKAAAPVTTERTRQRLRMSRPTAHLARRVEALEPGVRIVVVIGVKPDGERWWDVICTERAQ